MENFERKVVLVSLLLCLICSVQVSTRRTYCQRNKRSSENVKHTFLIKDDYCCFAVVLTINHAPDSALCRVLQVGSLPLPDDWDGLLQRTKRSLLWRWNSMKPVGGSCRDHSECGTNYCR